MINFKFKKLKCKSSLHKYFNKKLVITLELHYFFRLMRSKLKELLTPLIITLIGIGIAAFYWKSSYDIDVPLILFFTCVVLGFLFNTYQIYDEGYKNVVDLLYGYVYSVLFFCALTCVLLFIGFLVSVFSPIYLVFSVFIALLFFYK